MHGTPQEAIGALLDAVHELIERYNIGYDEYQQAKQWLIDIGEASEWPLFLDVFVEHAVERVASRERRGSSGTILGPYRVPDAPLLAAPFHLPRRPHEAGEPLVLTGRVLHAQGGPIAGAELDVWHADAQGLYSGFAPELPEGILRGRVHTHADGRYTVRTVTPAPYTVPHDGPTGRMIAAAEWHPWRPAHIHLIVSAREHEPLVTQLYLDTSEYLDSDVACAVKDELIVHPQARDTDPDDPMVGAPCLGPVRLRAGRHRARHPGGRSHADRPPWRSPVGRSSRRPCRARLARCGRPGGGRRRRGRRGDPGLCQPGRRGQPRSRPHGVATRRLPRLRAGRHGQPALRQRAGGGGPSRSAIAVGDADVVIGGGVESMSRAPYVVPKSPKAYPTGAVPMEDTTLGWRLVNPAMERLGHTDPLGITAETLAAEYHIGRDEQDAFAAASHHKAVAAIESGRLAGEIAPVEVRHRRRGSSLVDVDEGPRRDTSLERLAALEPAFRRGGSVTAGNSSQPVAALELAQTRPTPTRSRRA